MTEVGEQVRVAAAALVTAFASNDLDRYLSCFSEDATFLFASSARLLTSRQDYRERWEQWVRDDGFRVLSCTTHDTVVQELGRVAVLTHSVDTRVATLAGTAELSERETIVFAQSDEGAWLAVHEHLSPAPAAPAPGKA